MENGRRGGKMGGRMAAAAKLSILCMDMDGYEVTQDVLHK